MNDQLIPHGETFFEFPEGLIGGGHEGGIAIAEEARTGLQFQQ
eukprot:CAMPEP_0202470300 /NCGR_PEP_ID=MMETSP1360-20130828/81232_1 /ASSEMBLY_ACC=CAM_ASM_000848 /TAXON_ID=515479 /ORGANISM="Licmophora paradoxa, Strain CCMP2313" /LENGTH=42 /DNA_ID= /DNA_START= /DNA_END= /DNA_ORIENTATION=